MCLDCGSNQSILIQNSPLIGPQGPTGQTGPTGPQGIAGSNGAQGTPGGVFVAYAFSDSNSDSDPGVGKLKLDNADLSLATAMYINEEDTNGADTADLLELLASNEFAAPVIQLTNYDDPTEYVLFLGDTSTSSTYTTLTLSFLSGSVTSFTNNTALLFSFTVVPVA